MRIHALTTGTARVKHAFLYAKTGLRRQLDLFLPGPWSDPLPIHCWAIEHGDRLIVVDTGETSSAHDIPFARFDVAPDQELPAALEKAGLALADVDTVVLTHLHADHMDGAVHVRGPVLVHERELAFARSLQSRFFQRVLRQPLPAGVDFRGMTLDGGPFGAFAESRPLTDDGRVVAVATPGHTPGHTSVVCVDDDGHHVLLAGDATDTIEQLHARRADAVAPKPAVSIETMDAILAHGRSHRTVFLPSHDPESVARLELRVIL
jgi:glyoxylase-like metal-dependent hydrolase (beta-lactamase superfamily II)